MEAYVADWLNLLARWLHLITGIAWIGSSLYFVWLDNHLVAPKEPGDAQRGVSGEIWSVHGGGFYHAQKYPVGPKGEPLNPVLHWFKWEAYWTWMSGMALLAIIYWWGANTYLIDRSVLDLSVPAAIAISAGSLAAGWVVYHTLCKLIRNELGLAAVIYVLLVAACWGYTQVFGARAAYLHAGALIGTIMVWNVFFCIIPGQRRMVEAIRAGTAPNPADGLLGKQRSVHNTYLTLPVLFIMISNHYPMTFGNKYSWLVLAAIILAGALIRQFFVLRHFGRLVVGLPLAAIAILLALAFAMAPAVPPTRSASAAPSFASVQAVIDQRCAVCHAEKPSFAGFAQAPNGLMLDTPERIKAAAQRIHQQAVATQAMPIGNLTQMTPEERALLDAWYAAGARIN